MTPPFRIHASGRWTGPADAAGPRFGCARLKARLAAVPQDRDWESRPDLLSNGLLDLRAVAGSLRLEGTNGRLAIGRRARYRR
ncbi:hypothetical protein [Roseibium aquae]|uniref:hypothetical protein n=1 Tax=Roseibium aquae TaxID=1323746 RepID=UPI00123D1A80|nr:hypothetical protein [Roseibium aquae]